MNKHELLIHLHETQDHIIEDLKAEIDSYHQSADLDEEDTLDPEDYSHQTEAGHVEHNLKEQLRKAEYEKDILNKLGEESKDEIGPGALIELDDRFIYVGIATLPFKHEGEQIVSISTEAPIYPLIRGRKAGDSIKLGKDEHPIVAIY